jgi:hypothetical protein
VLALDLKLVGVLIFYFKGFLNLCFKVSQDFDDFLDFDFYFESSLGW